MSSPRHRLLPPTSALPSSNNTNNASWLDSLRAYPPAAAAALTGLYALAAGAALIAAPAATLAAIAPVAAATVPAGWVRLGGLILATFGAQYALASWHDREKRGGADAFYRASVPSRLALAAGLAALVAYGQVEKGVIVLAVLNATGALSMRRALGRVSGGSGGSTG